MGSNDFTAINQNKADFNRFLDSLTAHDIVGSISNIANLGELLENGISDFSAAETGHLVKLQAQRVASLIDTISLAEQARHGQLALSIQPQSLRPTLMTVMDELQPLSSSYETKLRLFRTKRIRPVLADSTVLGTILSATLEGIIRTTISKRINLKTVSHDDKLFLHITDQDASSQGLGDGFERHKAGVSHTIAIPAFYAARELIKSMNGEMRVVSQKNLRHIDLVFPHSVQLSFSLSK